MYWIKPMRDMNPHRFSMNTHEIMAVITAVLQVHSTIGQHPIAHYDAIPPNTNVIRLIFPHLHLTLYHHLTLFHVISLCHLAPCPTASISHRLLATMPGDHPLPPDHTLRASLGLHFNQALLLTIFDLSCALGISVDTTVPESCNYTSFVLTLVEYISP